MSPPEMLPVWTQEDARSFDQHWANHGVSVAALMENAGRSAFFAYQEDPIFRARPALILVGPGNNGGDAMVMARFLIDADIPVRCLMFGDCKTAEARAARQALVSLDCALVDATELEIQKAIAWTEKTHGAVVDGILGTGQRRELSATIAQTIEAVLAAELDVLALDVPTGIASALGFLAKKTVTFGAHKVEILQCPDSTRAGAVVVGSLGVPVARTTSETDTFVVTREALSLLPRRKRDAHKGDLPQVLVLSGAMAGASILACRGALRAGASLVTLLSEDGVASNEPALQPEIIVASAARQKDSSASFKKASAVVLGPGWGCERGARVRQALSDFADKAVVLDADALNAIANDAELRNALRAHARKVVTPHPLEAARLLGVEVATVQDDRLAAAQRIAEDLACICLLKGSRTVVSDGRRAVFVDAGHPRLAVGGSGDVLSGVVAALLGEKELEDTFQAAWLAALWHAVAGESLQGADRGFFASEIADALPKALFATR